MFFRTNSYWMNNQAIIHDCAAIPRYRDAGKVTICPLDGTEVEDFCSIPRECSGRLHDCKALNGFKAVCISDSSDGQIYEYYYGQKDQIDSNNYTKCQERSLKSIYKPAYVHYTSEVWSYTGFEHCQCMCDEEDYWIDTSPVFSDFQNDMVIVGAKFVLTSDKVLKLSIQQGKLLPDGTIDVPEGESLPWITEPSKDSKTKLIMSTKIRLGTNLLPDGRVLVGLGPYLRDAEHHTDLLLVQYSANYATFGSGEDFRPLESIRNIFQDRELDVRDADSPDKAPADLEIQNENAFSYVELVTSNGKDGGKSTIPFFDGQEVTPSILTPLSGAGLYWKGKKGSGGFIGIELYTWNIVPNILKALR
ncbi:hypothetical protein QAD02_004610 [Eretmocerus hayati]|uniref:Uncharacterized protein n=1 Tax=Eretmocerus hayati TaxID=131215 RepID=A0ACC2NR84_9HYME|nr:hypothetical protein QAD02_004610 [Eretmocerus hayati]